MKKTNLDTTKISQQEKLIEKAMRTGGFGFPQTVKEVIEFEKNYGTTDMILPESLKEPIPVNSKKQQPKINKPVSLETENLAMAAREGMAGIPNDVLKLMAEDRKKADSGGKKKKRQYK